LGWRFRETLRGIVSDWLQNGLTRDMDNRLKSGAVLLGLMEPEDAEWEDEDNRDEYDAEYEYDAGDDEEDYEDYEDYGDGETGLECPDTECPDTECGNQG